MRKLISGIICLCAILCLSPTSVWAQINGLHVNPRVFNDFSTSTLTISTSNSNPGSATIDDRGLVDDGQGGNFANRHDVLVSTDNGASNATFATGQGFTFSTTLTLTDGSNAPRKEAGIRINSSPASGVGDVLFLVNSDAGEIVAFGGGAPFHIFGSNGGGNGYTPGTPITLGMRYDPPGLAGPNGLITYSVNYPTTGMNTSFSDFFGNLEHGPVNYNFGVYTQVSPANGADFDHAVFNSVTASLVPEPAALGLICLGGLTMARRRKTAA